MKKIKVGKDLAGEMDLAIRVSIACILNGVLPSPRSPFLNRLKAIALAYRTRKRRSAK